MLISAVSNLYNKYTVPAAKSTVTVPLFGQGLKPLHADIVSFSGKSYEKGDILNPRGHCAYCGQKIYDDKQIDAIAREMLELKSERLEGKIKSVLEKLKGAKDVPDLALAKQEENSESIDFFNTFGAANNRKPYAKGSEIFAEDFGQDYDTAVETLKRYIKPLLATVDHILPQRLNNENDNVDVNLVEACYCCNHDIKNGDDFGKFFTRFPAIKENMPKDKFLYARSALLDNPDNGVTQRMSAATLMKHADLLIARKRETENELATIENKIKEWNGNIEIAIEGCQRDIEEDKAEIAELTAKLEERKKDAEFCAMLKRNKLYERIEQLNTANETNKERISRLSNAINEIRYEPVKKGKKSEKTEKTLTQAEKDKITEMIEQIEALRLVNEGNENTQIHIMAEIEALDKKFPDYETYRTRKSEADSILRAFASYDSEHRALEKYEEVSESLKNEMSQEEEKLLPYGTGEFDPDNYSEEQQDFFSEYKSILEALDFIDKHPNGGSIKLYINSFAKKGLAHRLFEVSREQIVSDFKDSEKAAEIKKNIESLRAKTEEVNAAVERSRAAMSVFAAEIEGKNIEEIRKISEDCSNAMKRIQEKKNDLEIPRRIMTLSAGIKLLQSTISELRQKQQKIEAEK